MKIRVEGGKKGGRNERSNQNHSLSLGTVREGCSNLPAPTGLGAGPYTKSLTFHLWLDVGIEVR